MAYDGLITRAVTNELRNALIFGKIEKIYQPEADELIFNIHTRAGNYKLYASCASSHARVHLITQSFENPATPLSFCMLLRKHLQGGRIVDISQNEMERIIEFDIETMNELGFSVNKTLIVEIMGKHSNIVLIDKASGKIIDSIKRISIDVNRVRQILPGKIYEYPPLQDKISFDSTSLSDIENLCGGQDEALQKALLSNVQGVSPAIANDWSDLAKGQSKEAGARLIYEQIQKTALALRFENPIDMGNAGLIPTVYLNEENTPTEFHVCKLSAYDCYYKKIEFATISQCLEYYYTNKASSNKIKQKSADLDRALKSNLNKMYLKKQRLSEDLLKAENSDNYRLYGELLTANLHSIKTGDSKTTLLNYYDNSQLTIPLDIRFSPAKNAQNYFKKYGKAKTAIKEKQFQLEETNKDIAYLESVAVFIENAATVEETEAIRSELVDGGYLKKRKNSFQTKKTKTVPYEYKSSDGLRILVGRNNKENDVLTFKTAGNKDIWFHTKDIPGSHVILFTDGLALADISEASIFEAAGLAAYHSKAKASENVPVDYVQVRYVKKTNGAKPGMVIFTNNRTLWVNPGFPKID